MEISELGSTCLAIATAFFLLALISVGLRVWAFHIRARPWKIADTLIVVSILFQCGLIASLYFEVMWGGLGYHITEISLPTVTKLFKGFVAQSSTWVVATTLIKLSVLFFYLDIFRFSQFTRWSILAFINFVTLYGIASLLCIFTICRPFPKIWNQELPGRCGNIMSAMFATAVINCVEDLIVVIIPLPAIWKLQMSLQKKLGLSALIGIGLAYVYLFTVLTHDLPANSSASIFGINIARLALASPTDDSDPSYNLAYQALFINLEVHIGLMNACIPMIKPLFRSKKSPQTTSAYTGPSGYIIRSKNSGYTPVSYRTRFIEMDKNQSTTDSIETGLLSQQPQDLSK